jgi:hypothetical protein
MITGLVFLAMKHLNLWRRRKLLDAEITNKTGAAKIAALKTRADLVLKDLNFLDSLSKTKSAEDKSITAEWLKANGASATKLETRAKNYCYYWSTKICIREVLLQGGGRTNFRRVIMLRCRCSSKYLLMSSAESF